MFCGETAETERNARAFNVVTDSAFRNYKQVLTTFAHKHRPRSENDFCLYGFMTPDGLKSAWVIWRQGNEIVLWEGQSDLDESLRKIDLKSDVVSTERDLGGSTYLVTRPWVVETRSTCDQFGVRVHVGPEEVHRK